MLLMGKQCNPAPSESSATVPVVSDLNLIFLLFMGFFSNKPCKAFKVLCTSAHQVFFRYSSGFIRILLKTADLINEDFAEFCAILLSQPSVF